MNDPELEKLVDYLNEKYGNVAFPHTENQENKAKILLELSNLGVRISKYAYERYNSFVLQKSYEHNVIAIPCINDPRIHNFLDYAWWKKTLTSFKKKYNIKETLSKPKCVLDKQIESLEQLNLKKNEK